jgi:gas vesicle protein
MKDENGSQMGNEFYAQLMKNWQNFQQTMQDQISTAMKEQQSFHDSFTTRWMEQTNAITKMMTGVSGGSGKEYQDVYNIWKNYQNKINARIMKVSSIENNGYLDLMQRWRDYTSEMMDIISKLGKVGSLDADSKATIDLYSKWHNFMTNMSNQITMASREGNTEYQDLTKMWFEFLDSLKESITAIPSSNPHKKDVVETWEKITTVMGTEISNLVSESNNHFKRIQKTWADASNQIRGEFSKLFRDINYEELYTGFFARTAVPGFNGGSFISPPNVKAMEGEITELKSRVKELESELKKRNS